MNKKMLYIKIRKFYRIFGEVVGESFITSMSDMTRYNVHDVLFDINEVLEGAETDSMYQWLKQLHKDIVDFCEKDRINVAKMLIALIIALAFIVGLSIGRANTIRSAELLETTDTEYHISFGGEVHTYTFEGGNN